MKVKHLFYAALFLFIAAILKAQGTPVTIKSGTMVIEGIAKGEPGHSPKLTAESIENDDGVEIRLFSDSLAITPWLFIRHGRTDTVWVVSDTVYVHQDSTITPPPPDSVIVAPGDTLDVSGTISIQVQVGGPPWSYELHNGTNDTLTSVICKMTSGGRFAEVRDVFRPDDLIYTISPSFITWPDYPQSFLIEFHSGLLPGESYTITGDNEGGPLIGWEFVVVGKKFSRIIDIEWSQGVGPTITTIRQQSGIELAIAVVSWNPNTEPDLGGYIIHYGTEPGNYTTSINIGNVTSRDVGGLEVGKTYYFVVTAYDINGNESVPSDEVVYLVGE